jgi:hypothetical protein
MARFASFCNGLDDCAVKITSGRRAIDEIWLLFEIDRTPHVRRSCILSKTRRQSFGNLGLSKEKPMRKFALICTSLLLSALALTTPVQKWLNNTSTTNAQTPGKDGNLTVTLANTIVNQYSVLTANAAAGATSLVVSNPGGANGLNPASLTANDVLLVIQMQGAQIDSTDTAAYGAISNIASSGLFEFTAVTSVTGNTITVACPLKNSYLSAGKVQVIKVPQYATLTVNPGASITSPAWNGSFGGIVAAFVQNQSTINGAIDVSGQGFRGGALSDNGLGFNSVIWRSTSAEVGAHKGEGVAGSVGDYDTLGGRFGRGAPANGGGGGTSHNTGGGGGANGNNGNAYTGAGMMDGTAVGAAAWSLDPEFVSNANSLTNSAGGGRGGYGYSDPTTDINALAVGPGNALWGGDLRRPVGGRGGHPVPNDASTRIFMGGGGGAAHENNLDGGAGGNGGGIVFLIGNNVTGTGVIRSNGANGQDSTDEHRDGGGGGGAGGSVVLVASGLTGLSVAANGGNGGNHMKPIGRFTNEGHGPGGGGGGGFVANSDGPIPTSVSGGVNGVSFASTLTEFPPNGATKGASGSTGGVVSFPFPCPRGVTARVTSRVIADDICIGGGRFVTIRSTVTNNGPGKQQDNPGAEFVADLPPQAEVVLNSCSSSAGSCSEFQGRVEWNGALDANQVVTITFRARIKNNVPDNTRVCFDTQVNYDSDGNGSNDNSAGTQVCVRTTCPPVQPCVGPGCPDSTGPGDKFPNAAGGPAAPSDQKPASVLVYPFYTSNSTSPQINNTQISITNTSVSSPGYVHLFFVNGVTCSVADRFLCLTAQQTTTFLMSDMDPDTTGFLVAVSVDANGWPRNFNHLIGDAYVKAVVAQIPFQGSYAPEGFAALREFEPDASAQQALISFDGFNYDLAPLVLAASSIFSRVDLNFTWVLVASLRGSLVTGPTSIGNIFGFLFDDAEDGASFTANAGCQWRVILSDDNPRTVPRFTLKIPATRTGWMKFYSTGFVAITGVIFNSNTTAGGYNGARSLHKLTLAPSAYTIPIFPPTC